MFGNKNTNKCETETAFTFAILLLNILILVILSATTWVAHTVITQDNHLNLFFRGSFLP